MEVSIPFENLPRRSVELFHEIVQHYHATQGEPYRMMWPRAIAQWRPNYMDMAPLVLELGGYIETKFGWLGIYNTPTEDGLKANLLYVIDKNEI